jgi:hypothetical protein
MARDGPQPGGIGEYAVDDELAASAARVAV